MSGAILKVCEGWVGGGGGDGGGGDGGGGGGGDSCRLCLDTR